ncbi:12035_t:CDS:1, partial [Racocetra fulgida]
HYLSCDTVEEFLATDLSESLRNALIELDRNVQKKIEPNSKGKPEDPKQTEAQINKANN